MNSRNLSNLQQGLQKKIVHSAPYQVLTPAVERAQMSALPIKIFATLQCKGNDTLFLVAPAPREQSDISSRCGVCLLVCGQIIFCKKLTPNGSVFNLNGTSQEVLIHTLQS